MIGSNLAGRSWSWPTPSSMTTTSSTSWTGWAVPASRYSPLTARAGVVRVAPPQQLRVLAASSEDAELMELMQLQNDEGPCLDCYRGVAQVSVADLTKAKQRWPRFVEAVRPQRALP